MTGPVFSVQDNSADLRGGTAARTVPTHPARAAVPPRHRISVVPAPKMDTPSLVAAQCACGGYRGGSTGASDARKAGAQHVAAAVLNDAAPILDAGLAWLLDTAQPDDTSLCQHLGVYRRTTDRVFGFIPSAVWPIVVMELADPQHDDHGTLTNPLTAFDVTTLVEWLNRRGRTVRDTWNGKGTHTVSVALAGQVHPTLIAAVDRYRRGCPEHPDQSVFCRVEDCTWWTRRTLLVDPAWPQPLPEATP